jgi:hypothetical protein
LCFWMNESNDFVNLMLAELMRNFVDFNA